MGASNFPVLRLRWPQNATTCLVELGAATGNTGHLQMSQCLYNISGNFVWHSLIYRLHCDRAVVALGEVLQAVAADIHTSLEVTAKMQSDGRDSPPTGPSEARALVWSLAPSKP